MRLQPVFTLILVLTPLLAAYSQEPQTAADYYKRGDEREGKNDFDGAMADYTKAIKIDPKFADAYCARAHNRVLYKDHDAAIADWDKCISLKPADDKYLFTDYLERGGRKSSKNDHDGAIADFTKSIELRPTYQAYDERAAEYSKKVNLDRRKRDSKNESHDFEKALADFDWLMKGIPGYWMCYRDRGRLYAQHGRYKDALSDYTEALRLEPKAADSYKERAGVYRKLGKKKPAAEDEKKAAALGLGKTKP